MSQNGAIPLLIVRPEPGASKTLAAAEAMGLDALVDPLFKVKTLSWARPPVGQFDALLITSANAIRHTQTKLDDYARLPALCVGQATADAVRAAGLDVAATGTGGVDALLSSSTAAKYRRLLHLTGRHMHGPVAPRHDLTAIAVYEAEALPLGDKAKTLLQKPAVVLLHSARAAAHFARAIDAAGLERRQLRLAAISEATAQQAGSGWADIRAADAPRDDALLALAKRLCHEACNRKGP